MRLNVMSKLTFTPRLLFAKENASPAWCHTSESVVAMPQTTVEIGLIQEMFGCNSLSVAQHSVLVHHSTSDFHAYWKTYGSTLQEGINISSSFDKVLISDQPSEVRG